MLGHPSGLFVLFFTEMWERFSYYGMRALLIMFFTAALMDGGWGWPREHAFAIFGTYTSLVYLSTLLGGYFADKIIGFRYAVAVGALLMTLGHACMALETPFFIYSGLTLLVFGSGFFKPNMTSIISEMYKDHSEKKDGAYTIFYMGVNAGAFLGILLCGYLGEKVGWSFGFGLAGIFMLFGLLQFWFAQDIFGDVGLKPKSETEGLQVEIDESEGGKRNPFATWQLVMGGLAGVLGLVWILNDPVSKISEGATNFLNFQIAGYSGPTITIFTAFILFLTVLIYRLTQYDKITRDKMLAVTFFAFITIFFWAIFEQAPGSLTIFARDYTDRLLEGSAGMTFKIVKLINDDHSLRYHYLGTLTAIQTNFCQVQSVQYLSGTQFCDYMVYRSLDAVCRVFERCNRSSSFLVWSIELPFHYYLCAPIFQMVGKQIQSECKYQICHRHVFARPGNGLCSYRSFRYCTWRTDSSGKYDLVNISIPVPYLGRALCISSSTILCE